MTFHGIACSFKGTSYQGASYVGDELSHSINRVQVVGYELSGGQLMQCQKSHVIYHVSTWKDSYENDKLKFSDTSDKHVSHFHASYLFWQKKSDWNIKYLGHGKIFESFFVLRDFVFSLKQLFACFEQNNFEKQNFIKLSRFAKENSFLCYSDLKKIHLHTSEKR